MSTLAMVARITFFKVRDREKLIIRKPNSIRIEEGWKMLTDTASIILPRNVDYFDKFNVKAVFQSGDPVTIELGYNGNYVTEFTGYVKRVSAGIPIIIECEDEMYKIKKLPVHKSYRSIRLPNLLNEIVPGYQVDALEIDLGALRFVKTNVGAVLEFLKQEYSLYSYMKYGQLVVGKIYQDDEVEPIQLHLEKNVVDNALNYKRKEDVIIKINAVSTLSDGSKIEVTVGDEDGENRQLSYYGIVSKEALKALADQDLKKYKVDGYDGFVEAFGIPQIKHGNKVQVQSGLYPDREGVYYVEEVITTFDDSPQYHREVKIGEKVTV